MKKKFLIIGATGSICSELSQNLYDDQYDCHLVGRNENDLKIISEKTNFTYSVCNVQKLNFSEELMKDLDGIEISGIAYCVGSIDIKPFSLTKAKDFISSYSLNLVAVTEIIRTFQENLKRNKVNGSVKLKLYKGIITIVSRQTKSNAYSIKKVSFEENKTFNKANIENFIKVASKKLRK